VKRSKRAVSRRGLLGAGGAAALGGSFARWTPGTSARASAQSEPVNGGRLQVGIISNPSSLDPSPSNGELYILRALYDSLVTFDAELNPQPGLAESWEFPDETTMVLNLRQGVKFHDGTDFDAEAVRINIEHTKDPETRTLFTSDFEPIDAVEVVDAHTARLRLKGAAAPLLASFAMQPGHMISPAALEEFGQDAGRNPVGTGPYVFQEWVEQDHVTVTRNPDYWDPSAVHLDEVVFRIVPEPTVRLTNLQAGDLDYVVSLGFKDVAPLRNDSSVQLFRTWAGADRFILNCGQPPFDNMALRQALQYALDREGLHRAVFFETGVIGYGPVHPPGSWAFDPDWKPFERSLDVAREKLAEGGMPDGFAFNVLVSDPINAQIAEIHQATFAEIGVQMSIERVDSAKRVADQIAMNYEASTSTWQTTLDPSPALYTPYHTNGSGNYLGYSNERVDELLEQAIATYDTELRRTLYREVDQILAEEAPCPIPYHRARIDAASAAVQGIESRADPQFEVRNVWLSQ
jgi:peptide/nickel transport system substrate-binding protein